MKHTHLLICTLVSLFFAALFLAETPSLHQAAGGVIVTCLAFFGVITGGCWLLILAFSALGYVVDLCRFLAAAFDDDDEDREFAEPTRDTVIESDDLGPLLVECDTGGEPTPPAQVIVHRYRWSEMLKAYEYAGCEPLSRYSLNEADRSPLPPLRA